MGSRERIRSVDDGLPNAEKQPDLDINFVHRAGNSSGAVDDLVATPGGMAPAIIIERD
ncbi:MAG TPA: hypothetical protein VF583_20730 [Bradyrhizobium sp.]